MKTWAYAASAVAAVGALALVALAVVRRTNGEGEQISRVISDCQDRVERLERELQRLRAATA